jgi:hypothetical protein
MHKRKTEMKKEPNGWKVCLHKEATWKENEEEEL